jgi:hypothetical protein
MLAASNLAKGAFDVIAPMVFFGLIGLLVWAGGVVVERHQSRKR